MPLSTSLHTSGPLQFKPNDISDPLTRQLLNPRKNETEIERHAREREEREASKRSKDIDDWIERERKKKKTSKIILLGQSQSGKSTTLKNLQLHFSPSAFEAERSRWKTVIHLNLVRSLRKIHEALTLYSATQTASQAYASSRASPIAGHIRNNSSFALYGTAQADEDDSGISSQHKRPRLSPQHRLLLLRLLPILSIERELLRALLPDSQSFYGDIGGFEAPWRDSIAWRSEQPDYFPHPADPQNALRISPLDEISVPASSSPCGPASNLTLGETLQPFPMRAGPPSCSHLNSNSARAFARSTLERPSRPQVGNVASLQIEMKQIRVHTGSLPKDGTDAYGICSSQMFGGRDTPEISYAWEGDTRSTKRNIASMGPSGFESSGDVAGRILAACAQDILSLWNDAFLRNLLCGPLAMGGLGLNLHEDAGFFLNDVERITSLGYLPTNDDIMRARLKTMGVGEHRFVVENSAGPHTSVGELIVYDVGGSRTQRHKWMPFFDDINVIVFLAPISVFDQSLAEDPKVNRLQDTITLWKDICQTPMLAKVDCLLFLNKCDLLHAKLKSGLVLKRFIPQYEGDNNLVDAIKYFRGIFMQIWRKHTNELKNSARTQRAIYMHNTSMIDIAASRKVIKNVQDCALRSHLRTTMVI